MAVARNRRIGQVTIRPAPGSRFTQIAVKRSPKDTLGGHDLVLEYAKQDAPKVKAFLENWFHTYLIPQLERDYRDYLRQQTEAGVPTEKAPVAPQQPPRVTETSHASPLPQNAGENETKKEGES